MNRRSSKNRKDDVDEQRHVPDADKNKNLRNWAWRNRSKVKGSKDLVKYVRQFAINFEEGENYKTWFVIDKIKSDGRKKHSTNQVVTVENGNTTIYLEGLFKKVFKFKNEKRKKRRANHNINTRHVAKKNHYESLDRNAQEECIMLYSEKPNRKDTAISTTPDNTKTQQASGFNYAAECWDTVNEESDYNDYEELFPF